MKFDNINDLARLPYFGLVGNTLILRNDVVEEGIIDFHAHLGWHYGLTRPINLWKKTTVKHLFPTDIPFDFRHYSALDFTLKAKEVCRKELVRGAYNTKGYSSTHTIPNIMGEMKNLGVKQSVILTIDYPVFSNNSMEALDAVNRDENAQNALPVFISLHPLMRDKQKRLKKYIARGARGIKLHTQMQLFRASDKAAASIYELAATYGLPVLFHTGLSPIAPSWQRSFVRQDDFEIAFKNHPRTIFIIGHGGGMDGYEWAVSMARTYPQVYIELSGQPPYAIEYIIRHADNNRILYGSDWPFYPMALPLAKTLIATEKQKTIRKKILYENAQRLLAMERGTQYLV